MALNVINGKVDFILISGKARIKNSMLEKEAKELIENGEVKREGKRIIVNDRFIFGDLSEPKTEKVEEPKTEVKPEVKEEPKRRNNKRKETKGKTNPRKIKSKRD